ncbi:MAG TPA: hypothetical protein VGR77_04295 [Candidatus Dormibacteraeota bacterium]|nr:hypothetical protein [Candidatus Dormibacteraeota bacterium]
MFTLLTTWISERIITVTAVSVLTVAAVPTTLIIVSHDDHNTVAVIQPADAHSKVVLVSAVKKAGDDLITKLNTAETGCGTQVTQTVAASKVAPAKLQTQLVKAKSEIHGSVAPLVAAIKSDEDRFAHLTFMTPQDEENELAQFNSIAIIALGDGHSTGTVTVTCQTVLITITETIQITIIQATPPPACKSDKETD